MMHIKIIRNSEKNENRFKIEKFYCPN